MALALVTGASRGFGRALAEQLAVRGWELLIDGRDPAALQRAAARIGPRAHAIAGDVTDPGHRRDLAEAAGRIGRVELLINNASTLGPSPLPGLDRYPLSDLEQVLRVNAVAPLALIQALLPHLAPGAALVNITSDAAVEPYPGWGGYGASKAALERISAGLAAERPDLRVYTFDPGDMQTAMHQAAFPGEDISDRAEPDSVAPALLRLLDERPPSGRYRAAGLLVNPREPAR